MKEIIPIHKLNKRSTSGLEMVRFGKVEERHASLLGAHRDDHYIFIFQESGVSSFMLDTLQVMYLWWWS